MSSTLATSPLRAPRTSLSGPSSAPQSVRTRLRLVPPLHTGAPRAPFVLLLGTLLVGGLIGLLVLHTALAEDSFRLHDLKVRSALLTDREQALEQQVASEAAPKRLATRAEAMGMVRSENPAFIRLSDGKILGHPKAGVAPVVVAPAAPAPAKGTAAKGATAKSAASKGAAHKATGAPTKKSAKPKR